MHDLCASECLCNLWILNAIVNALNAYLQTIMQSDLVLVLDNALYVAYYCAAQYNMPIIITKWEPDTYNYCIHHLNIAWTIRMTITHYAVLNNYLKPYIIIIIYY